MTYSLGHVLARSPAFAGRLLQEIAGKPVPRLSEAVVALQTVGPESEGRTDVEVSIEDEFFAVLEAKRGPHLPSQHQLGQYVPRIRKAAAPVSRLVAVTNAPQSFADQLLVKQVEGVDVLHLPWRRIHQLARDAHGDEIHRNKHLLDEFSTYLQGILGMETSRSNLVYVLSLGNGSAWGIHFKDVVNERGLYFDPVDRYRNGPPNYLAFRYDGQLRSIHHVERADVFMDPSKVLEGAAPCTVKPHYLFKLGPAIKPSKPTPNGPRIRQATRVWCMIDALLTSASITDALVETRKRLEGAGPPEEEDESEPG